MNVFEHTVRTVDEAQQRVHLLAFVFGVIKKFGDDRGASLCALLAFYGFLSLFPLLLLLVTVLGFFGGREYSLVHRVESSAFSQFPIVGTKLSTTFTVCTIGACSDWSWGSSVCSGGRRARCRRRNMRKPKSGTSRASIAQTSGLVWAGRPA